MASTPVSLIVGLGNPGARYQDTRHNIGARFVEQVATGKPLRLQTKFQAHVAEILIAGQRCFLLNPTTYMNESGRSVQSFMRFYRLEPESVLVVHDELDLSPGVARYKMGGGHGGHNGLRDIIRAIGTPNFMRLRLGIGHPGHKDDVSDYVLSRAGKSETQQLENAMMDAERVLTRVVSGDLQGAMQALHTGD